MILANVSIQEALDNGYLEIEPEPLPRERTIEVPECPYQTTSVDLRLHPEIWWLESGLGITMDLTRGSFEKLVKKCGKTREINEDQPFTLRPGKFVLGKTLEKVYLPLPPPDSD